MTETAANPDIDSALAGWDEAVGRIEAAIAAEDWSALRRLLPAVGARFDRLRALLDGGGADRRSPLEAPRRERLAEGARTLERLAGLLARAQEGTMAKIRVRRRARRAAQTYNGAPPAGPQHLRLVPVEPPPKTNPGTPRRAPRR